MKHLPGGATRCNGMAIPVTKTMHAGFSKFLFTGSLLLVSAILFTSCQKEGLINSKDEPAVSSQLAARAEENVISSYTGLSWQTAWELQQARAASSKYQHFENAIRDGYVDINVVQPEMGYHFLKMADLDLNFDYKKPEILVYNKEEDGRMRLVAVEYAVPIDLTPNTAPQGFSGSADVWNRHTGFGLWLLHAWVWAYNPEGVFNPTNPLIHLH
ncbi:MAG TPA: hypothetical protein VFX58_13340 [Chitinophagaceae bacterium]|nr:hypothetical protein [Chitinophagaceae bacterium]